MAVTFTTIFSVKTVEEAREVLQKMKDYHNHLIDMNLDKDYHRALVKENDAKEAALKDHMLNDSEMADHVCDVTITFMSDQQNGYESNYDVDAVLREKFPMGVTDSESGQGFFFINARYALDVVDYLRENKMVESVGMNSTFGLMISYNLQQAQKMGAP